MAMRIQVYFRIYLFGPTWFRDYDLLKNLTMI